MVDPQNPLTPELAKKKRQRMMLYALAGGAVLALIFLMQRRSGGTTAAAGGVDPSAIDPATGVPYSQEYGAFGGGTPATTFADNGGQAADLANQTTQALADGGGPVMQGLADNQQAVTQAVGDQTSALGAITQGQAELAAGIATLQHTSAQQSSPTNNPAGGSKGSPGGKAGSGVSTKHLLAELKKPHSAAHSAHVVAIIKSRGVAPPKATAHQTHKRKKR
jgi:hypothetical protein